MARNLVNRLWQSFLQLNIYKKSSSDAQTIQKELLSTRIYLCSLAAFILIITIVFALVVRTVNNTEYSPSHQKFLRLISKYPTTLHCPCSKIGIAYDTFVTTHVKLHQVCSSQFIKQTWIDIVFSEHNSSSLSSDDFRLTLSFFWQLIAGFCIISNRTWVEIMVSFGASYTFSPIAIAEELVQTQVKATLNDQINSAQTILARNLLSIRRTTYGNKMISALATNFYLGYPPENSGRSSTPRMFQRTYNNCSCLNFEGCPHPATFNDSHNNPITIPGMIADCLIVDGTLASTLECYYNQTCLSLLHQSLSMVIEPLSNGSDKSFKVNSTVEMLLNKIMIDEMTNEIRFDLFYSQCNPSYCSYSYTHRFDILIIVTTIIGIFGGVSFVLRLIAPFIARMILRWKNRSLFNRNVSNTTLIQQNKLRIFLNRLRLLVNYIRQQIINFNLFERQTPRTPTNIFREQLLTRICILLIIISSIAAGFYTFLVVQNQVATISQPSLDTYRQLYNDHSDTLQCPCSKLSIPYESFLNVTFILHQVCSSSLISPIWLDYLASFDPILLPSWTVTRYSRDFRGVGVSYFQLLATFCSLAKSNIEDAQRVFSNTRFINDQVLASPLFVQRTEAIIESYINKTQNDFKQAFVWIQIAFTTNYLLTGANANFDINVINDDIVIVKDVEYYLHIKITHESLARFGPCACATDPFRCSAKALLYINGSSLLEFEHVFSELPIGCTPLTGFLRSTFAWWYNETYLKNIKAAYSIVIHSQSSPNIKPLNTSTSSRFRGDQMENLIREMFMETWISSDTYFNQFYNGCAPISCSYTIVRRRDLIVVLFLLISICGGLNTILQILVPSFGKLTFFFIDWWKNHHTEHPSPSTTIRFNHFFRTIHKSIINMNLYKTTSTNETNVKEEIIYTRVYLLLFISCLSVLLFYNAVVERSITETHMLSSIMDYEHLLELYSDDINCPCTRISIPYNDFVTELRVSAFHQACSTEVILFTSTAGSNSNPGDHFNDKKDFRNFQRLFLNSLAQLCTLTQESVDNSIMIFRASTMFVNQLMFPIQFINEMNVILNRFKKTTPIEFARTLNLIRTTIQGNALIALLPTSWQFVVDEKDKGRNASFHIEFINYVNTEQNTSCSCATLQTCTMPAQIFWDNGSLRYTLEGIILGCYSLETTLLSSLSCFYSMACIKDYRQAMKLTYAILEEHKNRTGNPIQLNASLTRFNINDTIETLVYEMFIESWTTNVSYERFFNSCAPSYCTYKYYYRFDALELLTTFLSVYAGVSLGIRYTVPYLIKMIKKIRNRFRVAPLQ